MRVFVAGASGAIGTRLVPQLIDAGHEVIGTVRSPGSAERVRALGAKPVALELLEASAAGAAANVEINLTGLDDEAFKKSVAAHVLALTNRIKEHTANARASLA